MKLGGGEITDQPIGRFFPIRLTGNNFHLRVAQAGEELTLNIVVMSVYFLAISSPHEVRLQKLSTPPGLRRRMACPLMNSNWCVCHVSSLSGYVSYMIPGKHFRYFLIYYASFSFHRNWASLRHVLNN